jgi:hypothetical protein
MSCVKSFSQLVVLTARTIGSVTSLRKRLLPRLVLQAEIGTCMRLLRIGKANLQGYKLFIYSILEVHSAIEHAKSRAF